MSRGNEIACALAAAALAAPAVALADSPPGTTTTGPVSTVTTLATATVPTVSTPTPDAAPVRRKTHTRPSRVAHPAPAAHHSVTRVPPPAPVRSASLAPARSSHPVGTTHRAKRKAVHHRVAPPAHRARATPAKHARPVATTPTPVPAPAPTPASAARPPGNAWIAPAAIGGFIALLVGLGVVAGIRAMRRTDDRRFIPSPAAPVPQPPLALAAARASAIRGEPEREAELGSMPIAAPPSPDSCRITWWRGYVRSRFYAYQEDGLGEKTLVAESPLFSWRASKPPPESPAVLAAHARLVDTLKRHGWEPDGRGEPWYSSSFLRAPTVRGPEHADQPAAESRGARFPAPIPEGIPSPDT